MRLLSLLSLLLFAHVSAMAASSPAPASVDVLVWPRMDAARFGCYLEQTFGVKDAKFNCGLKNYVNRGDPCKRTKAYYEGPALPKSLAQRIAPQATDVALQWEHGQLQAVTLTFPLKVSKADITRLLHLPATRSYPKQYPNIIDIDVQECSATDSCVIIQGFEHMGAGDVDCGG
ncbi:MAG: hypothetical protein ACJ8GW_20295 [Massilia sp.]